MTWPDAIAAIESHPHAAVAARALQWCSEYHDLFGEPTSVHRSPDGVLYIDWRNDDGKLRKAAEFTPEGIDELQEWNRDRIVRTEAIQ